MSSIERGSSAGYPRTTAAAGRRLLAAALLAAMLAAPGCGGGSSGQATPTSGITPDEQAKQSRDFSRAQHEKTKGRAVRH